MPLASSSLLTILPSTRNHVKIPHRFELQIRLLPFITTISPTYLYARNAAKTKGGGNCLTRTTSLIKVSGTLHCLLFAILNSQIGILIAARLKMHVMYCRAVALENNPSTWYILRSHHSIAIRIRIGNVEAASAHRHRPLIHTPSPS